MKELSFEKMETVNGGIRFTPNGNCTVSAVGFGLGVIGFASGVGSVAGLSLMFATAGALMSCFPMSY
jgi:hypothetical protein